MLKVFSVKISVIVTTYNRANDVIECVDSILRQRYSDFEVIVIDDGSKDDAARILKERFSTARNMVFLRNGEPRGAAYSRNVGVRNSSGEVAIFVDDDAVVGDGWLEKFSKIFEDKKIGVVTGKVYPKFVDRPPPSWLIGYLWTYIGIDPPTRLKHLIPYRETVHDALYFEVFGPNMAFRRSAIEKAGPFREDLGPKPYHPYFAEEPELAERIRKAGYRVVFHPGPVVWHKVRSYKLRKAEVLRRAYLVGKADNQAFGLSPWKATLGFLGAIYLFSCYLLLRCFAILCYTVMLLGLLNKVFDTDEWFYRLWSFAAKLDGALKPVERMEVM